MQLTGGLEQDDKRRFDTRAIRPNRMADVDALVYRTASNRKRYAAAGNPVGTPWYVVGVIHALESSLNFGRHLHHGDPLTARTVQVPAGRPKTGKPPFSPGKPARATPSGTRASTDGRTGRTRDALQARELQRVRLPSAPPLRSVAVSLELLAHYGRGNVADGTWSPTAVSAQCGVAVLLRRMAEKSLITFGGVTQAKGPVLRYAPKRVTEEGKQLQRFLNGFPGNGLREDGQLGEGTSAAVPARHRPLPRR